MIAKLILALLNLITKIVGIILLPLDALVLALIPDLGNSMNFIRLFLNLPAEVMGWVINLLHVPSSAITLIISYWVFKYAVIGATAGIKKTITLYQRFKP